jgi:hypothetical protein
MPIPLKESAMRHVQKCILPVLMIVVMILLFGTHSAYAAPGIMNYQGTLTDTAGLPVSATKAMTFKIFATISDTTSKWTSVIQSVVVKNGNFSVNLGEQDAFPAGLFDNDSLFLGVTVDGVELTPRKRLTSVPYAMSAAKAGIPESGWISPIEESWTYASPTTLTILGDKTGRYQKGDKIKLNQTATKYFYIVGVTYSAPNTTVTVTGGSDYSLVNTKIDNPCFSRVENPFGFPDWFNYIPQWSASGSMTVTNTNIYMTKFTIKGRMLHLIISGGVYLGGTASAYIYVTPPVSPVFPTTEAARNGAVAQGIMVSTGSWVEGQCIWANDLSKLRLEIMGGQAWNVTMGGDLRVQITYEI